MVGRKRQKLQHSFAMQQQYPVAIDAIQTELRENGQFNGVTMRQEGRTIHVHGYDMNVLRSVETIIRRIICNMIMRVSKIGDMPASSQNAAFDMVGLTQTNHQLLPPVQRSVSDCFRKRYALIAAKLNQNRVHTPTELQTYVWTALTHGFDAIAVAPAGCGKILGYLLPAMVHCDQRDGVRTGPVVIVLTQNIERIRAIEREWQNFKSGSVSDAICLPHTTVDGDLNTMMNSVD